MTLSALNPRGDLQGKMSLAANGRIVIPAAVRTELGVAPDETLLFNVVDGVLQIESYSNRIRRVQESLRQLIPDVPGRSLVDELIAERREEARREEEEIAQESEHSTTLALRAR